MPISGCRTSVRLVLSFQAMASCLTGAASFYAATAQQAIEAAVPPSPRPWLKVVSWNTGPACGRAKSIVSKLRDARVSQESWSSVVMDSVIDNPTIGDAAVDTGNSIGGIAIDTAIDTVVDTAIDTIDTVIDVPVVGETDAAADEAPEMGQFIVGEAEEKFHVAEVATRQKKRFNNEDLKGEFKRERTDMDKDEAFFKHVRRPALKWPAGRFKGPNSPAGRLKRPGCVWPAGRLKRQEVTDRWFPILV